MAYAVEVKTVEQVKKFLLEYRGKYQKTPQFNEVENALGLEHKIVQFCFKQLADSGFFDRNHSQYKFKEQTQPEPVKTFAEQVKAKIKGMSADDILIVILRVIMLLVGIGAIVMLLLFTFTWGRGYLENDAYAFIFSITLIVFSVCSFQIAVIYSQNGQLKMAVVYFATWIIVLLFSMQASIAYMYNTNNDKEIQVITSSNAITRGSIRWNDLLKRESEKESDINNLKARLNELNDLLSQYKTSDKINADKATYNDIDGKVTKQEKKIATAEKELAAIRSDKDAMLDKEQQAGIVESIDKVDFYIAAGKIINADGKTLEFIVSCFPAVFFDVVAPLSISVALFLKRRDKKKSKLIEFLENIFIKKGKKDNGN